MPNQPDIDVLLLDVAISVALAALLVLARWSAGGRLGESADRRRRTTSFAGVGAAVWLAATGAIAASGKLAHWDAMPPPMLVLFGATVVAVAVFAFSRLGRALAFGLPLAALVGFQAFRILVEWMLHRAYDQGVIGVQMTWSGRNFDVASGASALALGAWLALRGESSVPRAVIWAWNVLGFALLANIVVVAVLSMPTRLRAFDGPPNAWVATFPFVWLPTVMVAAALLGHLLLTRRLIANRGTTR